MQLEERLKTMTILSITSVIFFMITMIIGKILNKILPKYNQSQPYIVNFSKLVMSIVMTTLTVYLVKQIPSMLPLPFKSESFDPKQIKEIKGTILVNPAFIWLISDTFKEYLALF